MPKLSSKSKQITLYVTDPHEFNNLREKVLRLWYDDYGMHLSKSDIIISALRKVYEDLKDKKQTNSIGFSEDKSVNSIFSRLSK